jgi:hypothetical protein
MSLYHQQTSCWSTGLVHASPASQTCTESDGWRVPSKAKSPSLILERKSCLFLNYQLVYFEATTTNTTERIKYRHERVTISACFLPLLLLLCCLLRPINLIAESKRGVEIYRSKRNKPLSPSSHCKRQYDQRGQGQGTERPIDGQLYSNKPSPNDSDNYIQSVHNHPVHCCTARCWLSMPHPRDNADFYPPSFQEHPSARLVSKPTSTYVWTMNFLLRWLQRYSQKQDVDDDLRCIPKNCMYCMHYVDRVSTRMGMTPNTKNYWTLSSIWCTNSTQCLHKVTYKFMQ